MISTILVPIGIIIFLKLNKFYQFLVLSLSALLPFSFGDFRSVPSLQFIEWLTLTTFLVLINELVPTNRAEKQLKIIKIKGIEIFIFAIIILITWTIISFINNKIPSQSYRIIDDNTGTVRIYFDIFNNILLFFTTIIFVTIYFEKINFEKFFRIMLAISLILGVLRIISHFLDFQIPLLGGAFDYGGEYGKFARAKYGGTAFRLGGLSEVVIIGIPALFALFLFKRKINFLALILLLLFLFFSGGRTVMIGTVIAVLLFSFLFLSRTFIYLISVGGLFVIFATIFLPDSLLQGQTGRMTTIDAGNFMGQDALRGLTWKLYIDSFSANPIWGKGIGSHGAFVYSSTPEVREFAMKQLISGGHGSYFSLLSTLGIGGICYFLIFIIGGIFLSFRKIKQYLKSDLNKTAVAVFSFMLLLIKSIDLITGGNGLNLPIIFFTVGLVASLTDLQNRKDIK